MDKDFLKEKISYYKTMFTLSWSSSFLLGSGISWALIHLPKLYFLVSLGLISIGIFLIIILFLHIKIRKLIKELNK